MTNRLEVIYDKTPKGGCGCNCGCEGSNNVEAVNDLLTGLESYKFQKDIIVESLEVSEGNQKDVIKKVNELLSKTRTTVRLNKDNMDELLTDLLPLVSLNGALVAAYNVPTLVEVVTEVERNL